MPAPKGFKYKAKGPGKAGKPDVSSYDKMEKEGKKRGRAGGESPSPKRRGKASASPTSTQKRKAKEAAAEALAQKQREEEERRKRLHYPKIDLDVDGVVKKLKLHPASPSKSPKTDTKHSHAALLAKIIDEVVRVETNGLEKYFQSRDDERQDVYRSLAAVLTQLQDSVRDECPLDAVFQPEIVPSEQAEMAQLQSLLCSLQEQKDHLSRYQEDMGAMASDYDLWLSGPPADEIPSSSGGSSRAQEMIAEYSAALDEVSSHSSELSSGVTALKGVLTRATQSQQRLYKAHQSTRLDGMAKTRAPLSTKDVIKGLSAQM